MNWEKILFRISSMYRQYFPALKKRFRKLSLTQKVFGSVIIIEAVVLICAVSIPEEGKILPIGRNVIKAYHLLKESPTGRELIKLVEKNSSGSFIYLTLGETEKDNLFDYDGEEVLACTRAEFDYYGNKCLPHSVTVIANRDMIGTDPREVVKSLAFELENVNYAYQQPFNECGKDSPLAAMTRAQVVEELGLEW